MRIDKIIELKKLLDSDLISQSDFDRLKKQIFDDPKNVSIELNRQKNLDFVNKIREKKIKNSDFTNNIENKRNSISNENSKKCPQCSSLNPIESSECIICKIDFNIFQNKKENFTEGIIKPVQENNDYDVLKYILIIALVFGLSIFYMQNKDYFFSSQEKEAINVDSTVVVPNKLNVNQELTNNNVDTIFVNKDKYLEIGMDYQGGKIAYIFQSDDAGYIEGEIHGIILSNDNLFSEWGCTDINVENTFSSIGTGEVNTKNIVDKCDSKSGAKMCVALNSGGYMGWFLPSKDELTKVYSNINQLGGYPIGSFGVWSSTEFDKNNSYVISFDGNGKWNTLPKSYGFYIKAIRYF